MTLSEITENDQVGVIELGMSEPGEMTVIAKIARVDMAVITNIGITHIGQLGSQENILREKLHITDGMKDGGLLILNGDDALLKNVRGREGLRTVYYGTGENCDFRAVDVCFEDGFPSFTAVHGADRQRVRLNVMGPVSYTHLGRSSGSRESICTLRIFQPAGRSGLRRIWPCR